MKLDRFKIAYGLAILTAVIYNSWPLGYILDPSVAGSGSASDLEAIGQPYNWLFVGGDILTGVLIVVIAVLVYRKNKLLITSLIGLLMFGLFTLVAALTPLNCMNSPSTCGYRHVLGWHDLYSALSDLGLFIAMLCAMKLSKGLPHYRLDKVMLWTWSILGLIFLLSAVPAINNMKHIVAIAAIWQDAFLILSGVLLVLSVYSYMKCQARLKLTASSRQRLD